MMTGYTFTMAGIDYFINTSRQRITDKFIRQMWHKIFGTDDNLNQYYIDMLKYRMMPATCEIKGTTRKYYEISGSNFGGRGTFVDDGNTRIIDMEN